MEPPPRATRTVFPGPVLLQNAPLTCGHPPQIPPRRPCFGCFASRGHGHSRHFASSSSLSRFASRPRLPDVVFFDFPPPPRPTSSRASHSSLALARSDGPRAAAALRVQQVRHLSHSVSLLHAAAPGSEAKAPRLSWIRRTPLPSAWTIAHQAASFAMKRPVRLVFCNCRLAVSPVPRCDLRMTVPCLAQTSRLRHSRNEKEQKARSAGDRTDSG